MDEEQPKEKSKALVPYNGQVQNVRRKRARKSKQDTADVILAAATAAMTAYKLLMPLIKPYLKKLRKVTKKK